MRIALYQGKSPISLLIRWQTRSQYSHAAFLLDDGSVIEAWQPCVREIEPQRIQGERLEVRGENTSRLSPRPSPLSALCRQHTPGTTVDICKMGFDACNCASNQTDFGRNWRPKAEEELKRQKNAVPGPDGQPADLVVVVRRTNMKLSCYCGPVPGKTN